VNVKKTSYQPKIPKDFSEMIFASLPPNNSTQRKKGYNQSIAPPN